MSQLENLWPETLGKADPDIAPPIQILNKQAEYFTAMMQNVLVADVRSTHEDFLERIVHALRIKVPALGNYNATILELIHHPFRLYPVDIIDQIAKKEYNNLSNEKDVVGTLKGIFRSKEMNQVVSSLLAQTRATMR